MKDKVNKPAPTSRRQFLRDGVRVVTLSFHSPSLEPGCTAYVRDTADLSRFLDTCRRYLEWFLGPHGGTAATPAEVRARLLPGAP